ncbi:MAG: tyrosine-protein phosphatase [Jatrophihabitans sp.]
MTATHWIELDGAANVRDVAGLPTTDGAAVRPGRLIRSDNLQSLSDSDVRTLVDDVGVRAIVDLRTGVEVRSEGPGPMTREPAVLVRHLSLFPEAGETTDAAAAEDGATQNNPVLPWQSRELPETDDERRRGAAGVYLKYLDDRADSVVDALRTIAGTPGATIVHCAAGKDRTGVIVAFALAEVGVTHEAIVEDYARSGERIGAIFERLRTSHTYAEDVTAKQIDEHRPRAMTMDRLLQAVDELHGGVPPWLRAHGWTDDDAAALRAKLLD